MSYGQISVQNDEIRLPTVYGEPSIKNVEQTSIGRPGAFPLWNWTISVTKHGNLAHISAEFPLLQFVSSSL